MADLPPPIDISHPPARISAVLAEPRVKVTSSYSGTEVSIFGAVLDAADGPQSATLPGDVVIIVRGPEQPVRVARKVQVAGFWLNSRPVLFHGAPGFYATRSSRALNRIAPDPLLGQLGAGLEHLKMDADPASARARDPGPFKLAYDLGPDNLVWRRAVVRIRQGQGLYSDEVQPGMFVDRGLFRASLSLPSTAPNGTYSVRVVLLRGGVPVAERWRHLAVEKVGSERWIWTFAHSHPWLNGLAAVVLAAGAGWVSSRIFRRG
jgi:uncharacterized protein (TIGR02186 family)